MHDENLKVDTIIICFIFFFFREVNMLYIDPIMHDNGKKKRDKRIGINLQKNYTHN
jgi:hypothetical protein